MDSTLSALIDRRNQAQQVVNEVTAEIGRYVEAQQRELAEVMSSVAPKQERRGRYRRNAEVNAKQAEAMRRRWAEAKANGTRVNAPSVQ